jgi:hypothetical protein
MPETLKNFLSELAVSPEKLANYQQNPDAAMKAAGLTADECAALKSGDAARVYACLSGQSASGAQSQTIWSSQPQSNCIWGAQPQANCIWSPQAQPNCIWASQPQADCIWSPQPPPHCIWSSQPQAPTIWATQPYTIVVHHFIHTVPSPAPPPSEPNQPKGTPGTGS